MSRILVADDHPLLLSGIARLLELTRHEVVAQVADGSEILAAISHERPDIAILDVNMPGATGLEVVQALRERDHAIKVILLTAELSDDQLLEAMELKVDAILLKNGGERLLVECLDKVAAGARYIPQDLLTRADALREERENDPFRNLTPRESELIELVAQGLRNRAIAEEMNLSEGTVKVYLNRVYDKLGISSRTELVIAMAGRVGRSG